MGRRSATIIVATGLCPRCEALCFGRDNHLVVGVSPGIPVVCVLLHYSPSIGFLSLGQAFCLRLMNLSSQKRRCENIATVRTFSRSYSHFFELKKWNRNTLRRGNVRHDAPRRRRRAAKRDQRTGLPQAGRRASVRTQRPAATEHGRGQKP